MNIMPWKPLNEMTTLQREIDSLWDRFFPELPYGKNLNLREWLPSIDLKETNDKLVVKAELPGLDAKDVELTLTNDILTIRGEKKEEREEKGEHRYFVESYSGEFERQIKLPTLVDTARIDATFDKGILTVNLPKTEEARKREIKIKVH